MPREHPPAPAAAVGCWGGQGHRVGVLSPPDLHPCSLQEAVEHEAEGPQLQVGPGSGQGTPAGEPLSPRNTSVPAPLPRQPEEPEPEEQFLGAPGAVPGHGAPPGPLPHAAGPPGPPTARLSPRHARRRQLRARPCLPAGQGQGQETSPQSLPRKGEPRHGPVPPEEGSWGRAAPGHPPAPADGAAPRARASPCACERVPTLVRAGWRCCATGSGAPCVTSGGTWRRPAWCVGSWATGRQSKPWWEPGWAKVRQEMG